MSSIRERLRGLSPTDRGRYESIIDRFEDEWHDHPDAPPEVAAYLPPDEPLRTLVLVALVKSDLESRKRRYDSARFEDYAGRFPELANDTHAAAEVLAWAHELTGSVPGSA